LDFEPLVLRSFLNLHTGYYAFLRSSMNPERKGKIARGLKDEELIGEVTRRLTAAAPGARVILFGSRARGDQRPNSDLDLLVIKPDEVEKPRAESARLRRELRGLGVGLDLLVVSARHVEDWGHFEGSLLNEVLSEGRVLVEA
jgi:uncharacterized protein